MHAVARNLPLRILSNLSLNLWSSIWRRHSVHATREISAFAPGSGNPLRSVGRDVETCCDSVHRLIDRNVHVAIGIFPGAVENLVLSRAHIRQLLPRMNLQQWTIVRYHSRRSETAPALPGLGRFLQTVAQR